MKYEQIDTPKRKAVVFLGENDEEGFALRKDEMRGRISDATLNWMIKNGIVENLEEDNPNCLYALRHKGEYLYKAILFENKINGW